MTIFFNKGWPKIRKLKMSLSEFRSVPGDCGEIGIPTLEWMSLMKCYRMLQNARVTAFTVFEVPFSRPPPHPQIRVNKILKKRGPKIELFGPPVIILWCLLKLLPFLVKIAFIKRKWFFMKTVACSFGSFKPCVHSSSGDTICSHIKSQILCADW